MLQNAYFIAKINADTAENEQHFAENLPKTIDADLEGHDRRWVRGRAGEGEQIFQRAAAAVDALAANWYAWRGASILLVVRRRSEDWVLRGTHLTLFSGPAQIGFWSADLQKKMKTQKNLQARLRIVQRSATYSARSSA